MYQESNNSITAQLGSNQLIMTRIYKPNSRIHEIFPDA